MHKPQVQAATVEKLSSKEAYLLDNGEFIYFYLGNQVPDSFVQNVSDSTLILIRLGFRLCELFRSAAEPGDDLCAIGEQSNFDELIHHDRVI